MELSLRLDTLGVVEVRYLRGREHKAFVKYLPHL